MILNPWLTERERPFDIALECTAEIIQSELDPAWKIRVSSTLKSSSMLPDVQNESPGSIIARTSPARRFRYWRSGTKPCFGTERRVR